MTRSVQVRFIIFVFLTVAFILCPFKKLRNFGDNLPEGTAKIASSKLTTVSNASAQVPQIAHFIIKGGRLKFYQYLSLKSIRIHFHPCWSLNVYNDTPITGKWWEVALRDLDVTLRDHGLNLTHINGTVIKYGAHRSDWVRINMMYREGGLYIDSDVWLVNSLDRFLDYPVTMGYESKPRALPNAAILAKPGAPFMRRWLDYYMSNYDPDNWGQNSVLYPATLALNHPDEVHTEEWSWMRPNYAETTLIYDHLIDFSKDKYMIHLWNSFLTWTNAFDLDIFEDKDLEYNSTRFGSRTTPGAQTTFLEAARYIHSFPIV